MAPSDLPAQQVIKVKSAQAAPLGLLDLSGHRVHAVQAHLDQAVREGHRDLSVHRVLQEILGLLAQLAIWELLDLSGHPAFRVI